MKKKITAPPKPPKPLSKVPPRIEATLTKAVSVYVGDDVEKVELEERVRYANIILQRGTVGELAPTPGLWDDVRIVTFKLTPTISLHVGVYPDEMEVKVKS